MLFATTSLARRIERAESSLIADLASAAGARLGAREILSRPIAGGVAAFAGSGSPANKVAGLGFAEPPSELELAELERFFAERAAPLQVELASLGDPAIPRLLTGRGYRLVGFENVLGLPLDAATLSRSAGDDATHEEIDVTAAGANEASTWIDVVASAFLHPDVFDGPPSHESFDRDALDAIYSDMVSAPSFERFLARRNGEVAGGATLRIADGVAQLCGAATAIDHRRRGVQGELLKARLRSAAARTCDIAVVTTQPGSKSQQNMQRFGLELLYTRAILVKEL